MSSSLIETRGNFTPQIALAFGSLNEAATPVGPANPLPTHAWLGVADSTPIAGSTSMSGLLGPFTPELGRLIWVTLSGSWSGTVQLLRSVDGGTTRLPVTYGDGTVKGTYSGNMNAAVAEETVAGAVWYLDVTLGSGTLNFRLEQ
jgi:hypothetical protein